MIHSRRSTRFKNTYSHTTPHSDSIPHRTDQQHSDETLALSRLHHLLARIPQNNLRLDDALDVHKRSIRVLLFQSYLSILAKPCLVEAMQSRSFVRPNSGHALALHTQNHTFTHTNDPLSDRLVLNHHSTQLDDDIDFGSCAERLLFCVPTIPNRSTRYRVELCLISRLYLAFFTIKLILISLVALFHNLVNNYSASQQRRFLSFYCDIRLERNVAANTSNSGQLKIGLAA